jgi:Helix-turn-helix domain
MRRREAEEAVRMARFLTLLHRWESAELNQAEAAELLGVSERTFRRWTRAYEEEGEAGLLDRRLGKASGRRVPSHRAEEVERLYRERLPWFYGQAFPRASHQGPRLRLGLHLVEAASAMGGRCSEGAAQRSPPQEARAGAAAGHDAAPGRLAARLGSRARRSILW